LGKCRYIVTSGFPEQVVLLVQNDFPAGLGLGAPLTRRAPPAGRTEAGHPDPPDRASVTRRAAHRARFLVEGEVVDGEPALDRRLQRLGFDHRVVPPSSPSAEVVQTSSTYPVQDTVARVTILARTVMVLTFIFGFGDVWTLALRTAAAVAATVIVSCAVRCPVLFSASAVSVSDAAC
jgi:hypothetical protein